MNEEEIQVEVQETEPETTETETQEETEQNAALEAALAKRAEEIHFDTELKSVSQTELKDVKAEFKEVSAPYRAKIKELQALIQGCNERLGVKPRVKKASKVQILTQREFELREEVARLTKQLDAMVALANAAVAK